jgi:hypothetical protein
MCTIYISNAKPVFDTLSRPPHPSLFDRSFKILDNISALRDRDCTLLEEGVDNFAYALNCHSSSPE